MLSQLREFIKSNQSDIFIILTIILVALITFGIGRLTAPKSEPILIKNLEPSLTGDVKVSAEEKGDDWTNYQGKVVGSKNSDKYHLPDCPGAKQISEQNKIWFDSIADAEKAGYKPAGNCPRLQK